MNGFVIVLLLQNGCSCYYATCKGDFMPVFDVKLAEVFYYAHAANKAAKELMKSPLGKGIVTYKVRAL